MGALTQEQERHIYDAAVAREAAYRSVHEMLGDRRITGHEAVIALRHAYMRAHQSMQLKMSKTQ